MFSHGDAILYMKVGTHAQESLASIIARKRREIEVAGLAMWGYGGNTCHPSRVQLFGRGHARAGKPIVLAMQPMTSKHSLAPLRAEEFSGDGANWEPIPESIHVLGSKYALCLETLEQVDTTLRLDNTRVALGDNKGKTGSNYVRGRVDKACLEVIEHTEDSTRSVPIKLVARLVEPFAVFLRS